MRQTVIYLTLLVSLTSASAETCKHSREELFEKFKNPENRIAFSNHGGLMNGGVCWWHSRLQRSAIYLTTYAPEKPKPTSQEAKSIAKKLVQQSGVVEIPGYANFNEFSADFAPIFQQELERWQERDGFIHQQWIRGLYGKSHLPSKVLEQKMDGIYQKFKSSAPGLWLMVQMKGITSHAFLLIDMKRSETGYYLNVIDSNFPDTTRFLEYHRGDEAIHGNGRPFTLYPGFADEQSKLNQILEQHCSS